MPSHSVLIFERDHDGASSLSELVSAWGYQPIVSHDPNAALKLVIEQTPTIIVDDASKAAEHFSFIREIRLNGIDTPVVLLTEHGVMQNSAEEIAHEDVLQHLEKPVCPKTLKRVVDGAIELAVTRRENELL